MRTVLVALLTATLGWPLEASAQVLEKAAPVPVPREVQEALTEALAVGMTRARRIENADPTDTDMAARALASLPESLEAAGAALDALAKAVGPGHEAELGSIRKYLDAGRPHVDALDGLKDRPLSAAAKQHAAAVREQLDLAESAHQKLMKALSAPKAGTPKPAGT